MDELTTQKFQSLVESLEALGDAVAQCWIALGEHLRPQVEAFAEWLHTVYGCIQREQLFRMLPPWLPRPWRLWLRDKWPRRWLPRFDSTWWRGSE